MFSKETETELSISDKIKTESKLRAKIRCFWKVRKKVIVVAIFVQSFSRLQVSDKIKNGNFIPKTKLFACQYPCHGTSHHRHIFTLNVFPDLMKFFSSTLSRAGSSSSPTSSMISGLPKESASSKCVRKYLWLRAVTWWQTQVNSVNALYLQLRELTTVLRKAWNQFESRRGALWPLCHVLRPEIPKKAK